MHFMMLPEVSINVHALFSYENVFVVIDTMLRGDTGGEQNSNCKLALHRPISKDVCSYGISLYLQSL